MPTPAAVCLRLLSGTNAATSLMAVEALRKTTAGSRLLRFSGLQFLCSAEEKLWVKIASLLQCKFIKYDLSYGYYPFGLIAFCKLWIAIGIRPITPVEINFCDKT